MTRNNMHALFLCVTRRLAFLVFVLPVYETGVFSFQQGSGQKEMGANIQTYWPRSQFTLRTEAKLVEVSVVVRDSQGRAIGGLTQEDFEIEDAGKKQEISTFSVETFTPMAAQPSTTKKAEPTTEKTKPQLRYVALLLDDYSMRFAELVNVKAAARRFVKEGLAKDDRVGLFTTSGRQIVPFTADVAKLVAAVDQYNSFPRSPDGGLCPKLTQYDAYLIANKIDLETYKIKAREKVTCFSGRDRDLPQKLRRIEGLRSFGDIPMSDELMVQAVTMWTQVRDISLRALETMGKLVDYMAQLPGRRMVLLASSGFPVGTLESEHQKVVNHALRAEVVINALDGKGLYAEDPPEVTPGADERSIMRMVLMGTREKDIGNDIMSILSRSTGGLFFDNNNDLDLGFRKLGMIPETSYTLGFSPREAPNGKYHGLKVRLKARNQYLIQARPGYWAVPAPQQEASAQERKVDREVMGLGALNELPAVFASAPSKTDSGEPALDVVLRLDAREFHFVRKDDLRTQRLIFVAALFDGSGNFVTGKEADIRFALQESTFNRLADSGLDMSLTLQAPPGTYRLRAVAQDATDGKIVSSTLPVEIR